VLVARAASGLDTDGVTVRNECGSLEIFADPLLEKVVYNLLENALRHGGKMTSIRVCWQTEDYELVWVFEDDGDGVPAGDKDRIFTKGFGRNTGFGLFLAREILAITDMDIAETGFPGKGARFEIRVPAGQYRF
jgi:signal transduction histidine kinase